MMFLPPSDVSVLNSKPLWQHCTVLMKGLHYLCTIRNPNYIEVEAVFSFLLASNILSRDVVAHSC
jgi:hypothetical protein